MESSVAFWSARNWLVALCSISIEFLIVLHVSFSFSHTKLSGKTTTATLVARASGRDVLELNASDARSKKALGEALGDVTGSQVLCFDNMGKGKKESDAPPAVRKKRCIIMDEVDGMGAGDRSGMSELIQMIKKSKVPIVSVVYVHFPFIATFPGREYPI